MVKINKGAWWRGDERIKAIKREIIRIEKRMQ